MEQLHQKDKKFFKGARYMDDVMVVYSYAEHPEWDAPKFCADFAESTEKMGTKRKPKG